MTDIEFYVLDSETNGLKAGFHELTEICAVRVTDRLQLSRNIRALYPERSVPKALEVTGKTIADILKGISQEEAIAAFEEFFKQDGKTPKHRCIIAHNAAFDQRFLHALWAQHNKSFPVDMWVDTIRMMRKWAADQGLGKPSVKLAAAAELLGTRKVEGVHNAVSDTQNLYFIWKKLIKNKVDYLDFIKLQPHLIGESSINATDDSDQD